MRTQYWLLALVILSFSCKQKSQVQEATLHADMQTFSNYEDVTCQHLDWKATVDFTTKSINGTASWRFSNPKKKTFIQMDTHDLTIESVKINGRESDFSLTSLDSIYGAGLSAPIQEGDSIISIQYHTGPKATALQWLEPSQTAGKKMPYLFTQCESIHARSLLPCQDVPAIRITYNAEVNVPSGMMAVMSAKNPTEQNPNGQYSFEMEIPVPSYLIALAVGDITYQAIDQRSGVYSEPSVVKQAAGELNDIPLMMKAAEELGGPYRWGRYDVLIAPPSFPIGGMENPRLTFATPTILAGDKSLVSLIAHEMAHSWSGNLVTNATWNDIWLNEGYTTYFERRIMEKISGKSYNDMLWELGYQDMQSDLNSLGMTDPDTRLRIELKGRHPEEAFTNIPYEKGAVFLRMLEENMGREKFDAYLSNYFQTNAFKPMTTEACIQFMKEHLFQGDTSKYTSLQVHQWIYEPGLPANCPHALPERFIQVAKAVQQFEAGGSALSIPVAGWSTHEWLQLLRKLKHPQPLEKMNDLDTQFRLTGLGNSEIADEWYRLAISSGYEKAYPAMEEFLGRVGRKKFLEPLYMELMKTAKGQQLALSVFEKIKANYHPQTAKKIERILKAGKE